MLRLAQLHQLPLLSILHPAKVKDKFPSLHHLIPGAFSPAKLGIHPGPEDRQGKGFCNVVLRPQLQPGHNVGLQVIGGEEDHRHPPLDLFQQGQAAAVGEVHIQDQQGKGPGLLQRLPGLGQSPAQGHRPVIPLQRQPDPLSQGQIVLQNQQPFHPASPLCTRVIFAVK